MPKLYQRRLDACNKLESAETKLLKLATKMHNKQLKAAAKEGQKETGKEKKGTSSDVDTERMSVARAEELVPVEKRPSFRLPAGFMPFSLPLIGQKVDTINWARDEIAKTTEELERGRETLRAETGLHSGSTKRVGFSRFVPHGKHLGHIPGIGHSKKDKDVDAGLDASETRGRQSLEKSEYGQTEKQAPATSAAVKSAGTGAVVGDGVTGAKGGDIEEGGAAGQEETYPPLNSAFILFNTQAGAHLAAQSLTHHEPYRMAEKYTEVAPDDVLWNNLGLNPYEKKIRLVISYAATAALIIFWAIPGTFSSGLVLQPY